MKTLLSISALLLAFAHPSAIPSATAAASAASTTQCGSCHSRSACTVVRRGVQVLIEVTVKRESNGEPISDVTVTATLLNSTAPAGVTGTAAARVASTTTTDISGRATFSNLAEGPYTIIAQREGYFGPVTNGGSASTQVFTSASVGPASNNAIATINSLIAAGIANAGTSVKQPVQHVAISMVQGGIISGRIQDANHRPAAGVSITPFYISYQYGQRILRPTLTQIQTDDLGQYRLFWFSPGEYYIASGVQPQQVARGGGANFPSPTYYPGTLDAARARSIVVREGQEISGTDFELQSGGGVTISGTVTNTLPGRVTPNGQTVRAITGFFLVPRNSSLLEQPRTIPNAASGARGARRGANAADETEFPFEIRGVPPGSYDFYPIFNDGATPRNNAYTGHVAIDVGTENISSIKSAIQPGVDLKVHVSVIGTPPPGPGNRPAQTLSPQNMRVQIRPVDNIPAVLTNGMNAQPLADAEGNITLSNLPEARLFISALSGLPTDGYVSEIRQGSRSVMDDTVINIGKESPDPIEIIIGRGGGTITGTLQDLQRKPLAGGRIFLIPDLPRRRNLLLYKTITSVSGGTFTLSGIAPGAYKLFAWDSIPQGAEQNDEFLSRYDGLGTRVVVSLGTPTSNIQVSQIQGNR